MAFGGILTGVFLGVVASVLGLCLGATIMTAFLLYVVTGGTVTLAVLTAMALRHEDEENHAAMGWDTEKTVLN